MKLLIIRTVACCMTFIIGLIATVVWQSYTMPLPLLLSTVKSEIVPPAIEIPGAVDPIPDNTVYSVGLCDLANNAQRYDHKIVRITAIYKPELEGAVLIDPACKDWIVPTCIASNKSCNNIWDRVLDAIKSNNSPWAQVELVGRYRVKPADPNPEKGGRKIQVLEITKIEKATRAKTSSR